MTRIICFLVLFSTINICHGKHTGKYAGFFRKGRALGDNCADLAANACADGDADNGIAVGVPDSICDANTNQCICAYTHEPNDDDPQGCDQCADMMMQNPGADGGPACAACPDDAPFANDNCVCTDITARFDNPTFACVDCDDNQVFNPAADGGPACAACPDDAPFANDNCVCMDANSVFDNDAFACTTCGDGLVPNADKSLCICEDLTQFQDADNNGECTACPGGQIPNAANNGCLEQLFFVFVVGGADFVADGEEGATNTDDNREAIALQLQPIICGDNNADLCEVFVISLTSGSVTINGRAEYPPTQSATIATNLPNARTTEINALGGEPITAVQSTPTNFDLCTEDAPCTAGQGDCDNNNECAGDLECGINNCPEGNDPLADCCYDPTDDAITGAACDGTGPNMWTCCATKDGGCGEGEGDCDSDSECTPPLVCGRNSCSGGFNTNFEANSDRFFPAGQADCCITKSRALFYGIPSRKDLEEDFQNDDEPF